MPPILLCLPTMSEADVGGMAVEVEPSWKYFITFCCCATDGSRGAVWQNGVWHGHVSEAKVKSSMRKQQHLLTVINSCWTFMETKQWMRKQWGGWWCVQQWWQWDTSAGADFYKCGVKSFVHHYWKCRANGGGCVWKNCFVAENLLYWIVLLCSLYLL